jgi:hypothetical protein
MTRKCPKDCEWLTSNGGCDCPHPIKPKMTITKKEIKNIIKFYQGMDYNPLGAEFRGLIARDILMEMMK